MKTIAHVLRSLPPEKPAVFLDPAPARSFEAIDVSRLACVTPNEEELLALSGTSNLDHGTQILQELGVELVVCTLGESGAYALRRNGEAVRCPAFKVDAVDSTASGDAFTAALAVAWASGGHDVEQMLRWACAAGAIAATRAGAWPSLPTEQEVLSLLRR
jgi:ribokinase